MRPADDSPGDGWQLDARGIAYPPEPWLLRGDFAVGVFLIPLKDLPAEVLTEMPAGSRPLAVAGRALVGVAGMSYAHGGVLAYDELLIALPVVHRRRLAVNIVQIWVTSPASRAGGRALWAIPKSLMNARRQVAGRRLRALYRGHDRAILAELSVLIRATIPGRWTLPLPTVQRKGASFIRSSNSVSGKLQLAHTEWNFGSSLAWLSGRRPVLGAALTDADVVFGTRVER